jgi:hypothetical protein
MSAIQNLQKKFEQLELQLKAVRTEQRKIREEILPPISGRRPRRHYEPWDKNEIERLKKVFHDFLLERSIKHQRTPNAIAAHIREEGWLNEEWNGDRNG